MSLKAIPGQVDHITKARKDTKAYAARERQALETHDRPHALRGEAWTLRALLKHYQEDLDKGRIKLKSTKTAGSGVRILLGLGKDENAAGFPYLIAQWVKDLD